MKMVSLAASERYRSIDCVFCVDQGFSPLQASQLIQVQTGFTGDLCKVGVHYFLASKASLSCCLAEIILGSHFSNGNSMTAYEEILANSDVTSRASFLLSLLPTLTVLDALSYFRGQNPRVQMQSLLSSALKQKEKSTPSDPSMSKAMVQLSHVLRAKLGPEELF